MEVTMTTDIYGLIGQLETKMADVSYKIRQTNESQSRKASIEANIKEKQTEIFVATKLNQELDRILKPLKDYNAEKQEKAISGIHAGIASVRSIITDSFKVALEIDKETAMLVNEHEDEINLTEGSAFRAMNAFFMRDILLSNTNYLQFEILDEPLTTLSGPSSAEFSNYLPLLSRNKQKILIEQKDEAFVNTQGHTVYKFKKSEGRTRVEKLT